MACLFGSRRWFRALLLVDFAYFVVVYSMFCADLGLQTKKQREFLIRLIYVEMLGQDASFGYIKAVEVRPRRRNAHIKLLC